MPGVHRENAVFLLRRREKLLGAPEGHTLHRCAACEAQRGRGLCGGRSRGDIIDHAGAARRCPPPSSD